MIGVCEMNIQRPGQKILTIGNPGLSVTGPRGGAAIPWYLAGGVSANSVLSAFQPIGAANYAASLLDLSGNGNNAIEGASRDPSKWDAANGWEMYSTTNGTTLQTSHKGAVGMTGIARFSNAGGAFVFGVSDRWTIDPSGTGVTYYNNGQKIISPGMTNGVVALTANKGYRNGALDTNELGNRTDLGNHYIGIGSRDGFSFNFLGYIQAIAFYNTTLTSDQVAAISAAMAAL